MLEVLRVKFSRLENRACFGKRGTFWASKEIDDGSKYARTGENSPISKTVRFGNDAMNENTGMGLPPN